MGKSVSLMIDKMRVEVPEGTLVVDAAVSAGVHIPVFCYHPKMEPVGMCRMCLVEIGRPARNRATGELEHDEDGSVKILFGPKLETACTVPVSEGMVVRGFTENVLAARKDVIEFLLTSHPLDCPICDKGGECPLQNLTMDYGPGKSRFLYDEKMHLSKHVPLGDLIVLDRERCIQCARCIRFQDEIVDDPVIGFENRGRSLQIVTYSEPGFDSYFSGNTTDICPVGALTTVDFRFQARPWELKSAASICQQCPVGCNLTFNVRREHKSGGGIVIKRALPRQNEQVNEIWICDKGRFGYHYTESKERLTAPLVRVNGKLVPSTWSEALDLVARQMRQAGEELMTLVGGRLPNEDLFNLRELTQGIGGNAVLYTHMAGGDLTARVGVGQGTNFSALGPESAILVVSSDLEEEAPIFWLRLKQAAGRGAKLIVANPRETKLDRYATHTLRYPYGSETALVLAMQEAIGGEKIDLPDLPDGFPAEGELNQAAKAFSSAENAIVLFGGEGIGVDSSRALAQACAELLVASEHAGRPNNGLIGVWPSANTQGAWDMGFRPVKNLMGALEAAQMVYIAAADPAGDDPDLGQALDAAGFVVVQELFLTETARHADVVLPVQAFTEREGSLTSAERRVQRFYPVVPSRPDVLADFVIAARIGERLGLQLEGRNPGNLMERIARAVPDYAQATYQKLAETAPQWPVIGRSELYYGGTSYENFQGLGVQLAPAYRKGEKIASERILPPRFSLEVEGMLAVPVTRLYDRGTTLLPSVSMNRRIPEPYAVMNPVDAEALAIQEGGQAVLHLDGSAYRLVVRFEESLQPGVVLIPRSQGVPVDGPVQVRIEAVEPILA